MSGRTTAEIIADLRECWPHVAHCTQAADRLAELEAECNDLAEALKDRRRMVLTRGGGISRRVVADPEADRLLLKRGPT